MMLGGTAQAATSLIGPYFGARFTTTKTPFPLGQDVSWDNDSKHVLSSLFDSAGISQVYRQKPDGSDRRCLTCTTVKGPNGFAQERPQGDWILFASYGQQPVHTGGPGLGGYGGDLYAMHADGSDPYRLTTNSDPDGGKEYTALTGTGYDNFHAFFSPNGRQVVWTHTEAHPLGEGGQTWSILVGDFAVKDGKPQLTNVRVVGKPYGAYESQPWAPDGSGFLFSAAGGNQSPYQARPPGWGNLQLYYMRIKGPGASIDHPRVTLLSDDMPAYEEQAILTPDMRTAIMMSNRSHTSPDSWANLIVAAAQRTGYDAPNTGATQTMQFLADFIPPDHFNADLYAVDTQTKAIRQLTNFPDGGVIPEFFWNRTNTKMIFYVSAGGAGALQSYVGRFRGVAKRWRKIPRHTPRALYGQPVDMGRIGDQAQAIRDPGPTDNAPQAVTPPSAPAPAEPLAAKSQDKGSPPAVAATYIALWLSNLDDILSRASNSFTAPPLLTAVTQFVKPAR